MTQADIEWHMEHVKYPAAREVLALLKDAGLRVLSVGNLARDSYRPPGIYEFSDLTFLVRDSEFEAFHQAMLAGGYRFILENPHTHEASEPSAVLVAP